MATVLTVDNITVSLEAEGRRLRVVEGVSFSLDAGKTMALVGESGCGKTMVALSILGLAPKPPVVSVSGRVLFNGKNLLQLPERSLRRLRGKRLAMIFQDPQSALNPVYTVGRQLFEVIEEHLRLNIEDAEHKVVTVLREVGLADPERVLCAYPHELSGGMKQRVMIAMALLCEPEVLIADEPTTALDVTVQAQVLELIRELQRIRNMAVLLITHDMGVVAEMADEVLVMYAARSMEYAPVEALFDQPSHPYTQGLFRSRPSKLSRGRLEPIPGRVPPPSEFPCGCRFHPRCKVAMPTCGVQEPLEVALSERHRVRCWLYGGEE